ncbi:hypothetical protein GCM10010206_78510 [Streptomyces cinerochromogenes]|nr:hypothetical protein GCM10010206_78510 [Streptomyces cinerochromogenes]
MVFVAEKGTLSASACSFQWTGPVTDRRVKYIAKRAAKNISSELSQMMVPTLVRFGRLTDGCACPVSTVVAVATTDIMSVAYLALTPGGAVRSVATRRTGLDVVFDVVFTGTTTGVTSAGTGLPVLSVRR